MSKGGGGGGGQQTSQTTQTQLPGWVNNAAMQNYGLATTDAFNLMQPYSGQRVAALTPGQISGTNALWQNIGATQPAYGQAQAVTNALAGYTPQTVTPQTLASTNLAPYMSPYTQSVINPTLALMEQQRQGALNQIGQGAVGAGAFGGSRQGVQEGVTNAQYGLNEAQMAGGLYNQAFGQAQAGAQSDIARNLAAQQFNSQMGLSGAQFQGNMAGQLGNLATAGQNAYLTGLQAAMGGQSLLQQQQQQQLEAAMQAYNEQRQYPLQQLQILQNALAQSPYGQTTYSQGYTSGGSSSPIMQGLGGLMSLGGLTGSLATPGAGGVSAFGNMFGPGAGAGAAGGFTGSIGNATDALMAASMFASDRRLKTDIRKVGRDPATDLPIYTFRYKGDPKNYPKVAGPMAQDVAKKYPDQVLDVGGYLAIKSNFLSGMGVANA